jgi:hypothetical protein
MARTIGRAGTPMTEWEPHFTDAWLDLLARLGTAIYGADEDGIVRVREDLGRAIAALSGEEGGDDERWPVHGALLVNLRNIADAMGDVAGVQPVRPNARHPAHAR